MYFLVFSKNKFKFQKHTGFPKITKQVGLDSKTSSSPSSSHSLSTSVYIVGVWVSDLVDILPGKAAKIKKMTKKI